ncbi:MAG: hypothetical protein H6839_03700 [Planctomycetes bacterium]|nr:hypothetical protein [Planctomycetota bacterium]
MGRDESAPGSDPARNPHDAGDGIDESSLPSRGRKRKPSAEEAAVNRIKQVLAECADNAADWGADFGRLFFDLARKLKAVSYAARSMPVHHLKTMFEDFIRQCEIELDAESAWLLFESRWESVHTPEGEDAFTVCWTEAVIKPAPLRKPHNGKRLCIVAAQARNLYQHTGGGPISLPRGRLGKALKVTPQAAGEYVRKLVALGILRPVDGKWSYTEHKALEYMFDGAAFERLCA